MILSTVGKQTSLFVDVTSLLNSVDQLQAWNWVLGLSVRLEERFCNPIRSHKDNRKQEYLFEYNGNILLSDFADRELNGCNFIKALMVRDHLSLPEALGKIEIDYIRKYKVPISVNMYRTANPNQKFNFQLSFEPKPWVIEDKHYWEQFCISSAQLEQEDNFSVRRYSFNTKARPNSKIIIEPSDVCYAQMINGHKKIYRPLQTERYLKWKTDVSSNDIGGKSKDNGKGIFFLKKAYKDYQVVTNQDYFARFLLSESATIPMWFIKKLVSKGYLIIPLMDNDDAGRKAAVHYANLFKQHGGKAFPAWLPTDLIPQGIKDPANCVQILGEGALDYYLKQIVDQARAHYA